MAIRRDLLLFDLDGTLVDSAPSIASALSSVRVARGASPVHAEDIRPLVSLGAETLVRRALGEVAGESLKDLALFREHLRAIPHDLAWLYPGVSATLDALTASGLVMAIVTNKPEGLSRSLLGDLALLHHFRAVIGGDTTPESKPHRAPLDRALALLGGDASRSIFIGDSAVDAAAARGLNIPFLLYTGGYGAEDCATADVAGRFDDFAKLPELVASIA